MLVGRERECERLRRLLDDAAVGRSGALVLRGEAGVGKTALLDFAIQEATGFEIVHVVGVESEAELPYAGLHAVLHPFGQLIDGLPDVQARAVQVALGLQPGQPDPFLTGAGALTLLAAVTERGPLLLAVDDAQWLDRASLDTLLFVARRLAAERIAAVFVVRTGETALERSGLAELAVEPLSENDSLELLRDLWGSDLAPPVAQRLAEATAGNPLALVEVTNELSEDQRLGRAPLSDALPVSRTVERGVRRRLDTLPVHARDAALLAAIDDAATRIVDADDLASVEAAGLLHLHRERIVFSHPLFRSAVYQSASPEDRRSAHRRIAEALDREDEEDLRAWHIALATDEPDEEAAAALEAVADRAEARGGTAARARALERAAQLSPDEIDRGRRLYAAARAATWAGETNHARDLIERALPDASDPLVRADLLQALAAVADWQGPSVPVEVLEAHAEAVEGLDADRAAQLLIFAIQRFSDNHLSIPDELRIAKRLEVLAPRLGPWWRPRVLGEIAFAKMLAGDARRAHELADEMLEDTIAAATQGLLLVRMERDDDARLALDASLELGRSSGQPVRIAWTQACFGTLHYALGRTAAAVAAFSEAASVARDIEANSVAVIALLALAEIAADQGRVDDVRRFVSESTELGRRLADEYTSLAASIPQARLALADGRYEETVELLRPVDAHTRASGLRDPTFIPYASDLVEAHIRRGDADAARELLGHFAETATATGCRWALAGVARYEGLLADEVGCDTHFAVALEHHACTSRPLAEARTRLCYGERLRRSRRRRDAREQLRAALNMFEKVGASAWATRARIELEATGERIPRRDPTAPERLTPQELQIALQVAEGKSNRDVAATLYLSPKTVEYHLTHVYRKLDIHSRAELIRLLAAGAEAAATIPAHGESGAAPLLPGLS